MNIRKHHKQEHGHPPLEVRLDEASSARWFEGFEVQAGAVGDASSRLRENPVRRVQSDGTWLIGGVEMRGTDQK